MRSPTGALSLSLAFVLLLIGLFVSLAFSVGSLSLSFSHSLHLSVSLSLSLSLSIALSLSFTQSPRLSLSPYYCCLLPYLALSPWHSLTPNSLKGLKWGAHREPQEYTRMGIHLPGSLCSSDTPTIFLRFPHLGSPFQPPYSHLLLVSLTVSHLPSSGASQLHHMCICIPTCTQVCKDMFRNEHVICTHVYMYIYIYTYTHLCMHVYVFLKKQEGSEHPTFRSRLVRRDIEVEV